MITGERDRGRAMGRRTTGMRIMRPRKVRVARWMRQVRVRVRVCRHWERIALAVHLHFRSEAAVHYLEHRVPIHLPPVTSAQLRATILNDLAASFLRSCHLLSRGGAPTRSFLR